MHLAACGDNLVRSVEEDEQNTSNQKYLSESMKGYDQRELRKE